MDIQSTLEHFKALWSALRSILWSILWTLEHPLGLEHTLELSDLGPPLPTGQLHREKWLGVIFDEIESC